MGSWGTKLYEDDYTMDVREFYINLLESGVRADRITRQMEREADVTSMEPDDALLFWLALADTQWDYGRLTECVLQEANKRIDAGGDLKRWEVDAPECVAQRREELERIRQKINSPMPPVKKIVKQKGYRCDWKNGDVFSYVLEPEQAQWEGHRLPGRQLYLIKVGERNAWPNHVIPIVWVKVSHNITPTPTTDQLNQAEFILTDLMWRQKGWPSLDETHHLNSVVPEDLPSNIPTPFMHTPSWRLSFYTKRASDIPKKLTYVGNYADLIPPEFDFMPKDELFVPSIDWKDFELVIARSYVLYNLQTSPLFSFSGGNNVDS